MTCGGAVERTQRDDPLDDSHGLIDLAHDRPEALPLIGQQFDPLPLYDQIKATLDQCQKRTQLVGNILPNMIIGLLKFLRTSLGIDQLLRGIV